MNKRFYDFDMYIQKLQMFDQIVCKQVKHVGRRTSSGYLSPLGKYLASLDRGLGEI